MGRAARIGGPRGAMGQVSITLNGRTYRLRCGDGEESRLLQLSGHVRDKIERLAAEFGQVGDDRLMVMAALLITDELFEARTRLDEGQPADPSLFEPLPEAGPLSRQGSQAPLRAAIPPAPVPPLAPPPAAQPQNSADLSQPDSSLKRALKRPQARQSLNERLAEAREMPPAGERPGGPGRKTGNV